MDVIHFREGMHLSLASQTAERGRENNPIMIALERCASVLVGGSDIFSDTNRMSAQMMSALTQETLPVESKCHLMIKAQCVVPRADAMGGSTLEQARRDGQAQESGSDADPRSPIFTTFQMSPDRPRGSG